MPGTVYVYNEDPEYFFIHYLDNGDPGYRVALQAKWRVFNRTDPARRENYKILVRPSSHNLEVIVEHLMPSTGQPGRYRVESFIPGKHATSRRAIFSIAHGIHSIPPGQPVLEEKLALVDMYELHDMWMSLGEYHLNPRLHAKIGRVCQFDISIEDPTTEISFGPVRWVPLSVLPGDGQRFDSPVGDRLDCDKSFPPGKVVFGRFPVWIGEWFDTNPFLNWYTYGFHTGADLNLLGSGAADKGKPVYAAGDGQVTYAGKAGSWGNIIVIQHPEAYVSRPDGDIERQVVYTRYGHVDDHILVHAGQTVKRCQQIGYIGLPAWSHNGWHLHFDVSFTDILNRRPAFWPDISALHELRENPRNTHAFESVQALIMRQVVSHFIDPLRFIQDNHNVDV